MNKNRITRGKILALAAVVFLSVAATYDSPFTFYVSPTGNDANRGSQTSPFRTISNAVATARSGDTVHVLPGTYAENNLAKDGITLRGEPGADIVYVQTTTNDAGAGILDNRFVTSGVMRMNIDWPGTIAFISYTNYAAINDEDPTKFDFAYNTNTLAAICVTNPNSYITGSIGKLAMGCINNGTVYMLMVGNCSNMSLTIGRMEDPFLGVTFDIYQDESTLLRGSVVNGILWQLGNLTVDCPYISATAQSLYWLEPSSGGPYTNDFYFTGGYLRGYMYGQTFSPMIRGWIRAFELYAPGGDAAIKPWGGGKWYFDFQRIHSPESFIYQAQPAGGVSNGVNWVRAMKASGYSGFVSASGGTHTFNVDTWDDLGAVGVNGLTNALNGMIVPHFSQSFLTNIAAGAATLVLRFPNPMPGTNVTVSPSLGFNTGTTNFWVNAITRSNATLNFPAGGSVGGQVRVTVSQNTQ